MKKSLIIVGVVVLVLLLGGAAYVGGRLLNGQGLPVVSSGGSGVRIRLGNGPAASLDIQPAKELPQTSAEVKGSFDHRQDNSIFVGTGQVTMLAQKDQSGNMQTTTNHTGPTVEVVVTAQTKIYHDTTLEQFNGPPVKKSSRCWNREHWQMSARPAWSRSGASRRITASSPMCSFIRPRRLSRNNAGEQS